MDPGFEFPSLREKWLRRRRRRGGWPGFARLWSHEVAPKELEEFPETHPDLADARPPFREGRESETPNVKGVTPIAKCDTLRGKTRAS